MVAITLVHPIDVVKSRMQFAGELGQTRQKLGVAGWLRSTYQQEGLRSLYRGLPAAYGLQFSVTATRFGTYSFAKSHLPSDFSQNPLSRFALAGVSGGFGAVAGNPFFAIKTRMQVYSTSKQLQVGTQHAPVGLWRALVDIGRHEGWRGYFRGLDAFMPRVVFYGAAQLASYDTCQHQLRQWTTGPAWLVENGFPQHVFCGVVAALCSVTMIQPFDFIAVRMQNQPVDPVTRRGALYLSPLDCAAKSIRAEGLASLFKGYPANFLRFGPYTVCIFVLVEQFRALFKRLGDY